MAVCAMKNITITLSEDSYRWLQIRAAENDRSASRWLAELIEGMRRYEDEYETAMRGLAGLTVAGPRAKSCMTGAVFVDTNDWSGNQFPDQKWNDPPSPGSPCAVERRCVLAGSNPARQLLLQPVAIGAVRGGNDTD